MINLMNLTQLQEKRLEIKDKMKAESDYFFLFGLTRQLEQIDHRIQKPQKEEEE